MLRAEGVIKRYGGVTALEGVDLEAAEGECVALVGESGSGKTTLLRCFNRMVDPDAGRVLVGGRDVRGADPIQLRRATAYVQQEGGLMPHWTVLRNAGLVPWLQGRSDVATRARTALELVGLDSGEFAARRPRELSGGQRQRVAIARALADRPSLLLMDEPFGALDAITRADLHEMLIRLRGELRVTILLVTHDLREAELLGDRMAVMRHGRIEQIGTASDLRTAPATPYVERLLERARLS